MSDWDGLKSCDVCGNYTTGRLCRSCREQEAIDNDDMADMFPEDGASLEWYDDDDGEPFHHDDSEKDAGIEDA